MPQSFDRLHRSVQEFVWNAGWSELRPIQSEAIQVVYDSEKDLLLSAPTASGKTEAAFMPVLSKVVEDPSSSVRALYVGPLKALINDQFRRLENELCRHADIPVHRWHGDVSSSKKKKLVEQPSGVLLITPESIESLFVNRSRYLSRLFASTEFVVIDEIHSFMGTERGAHLRSLLSRLDDIRGERARRIGLSATVGEETDEPKRWLSGDHPDHVELIEQAESGALQAIIHGYEKAPAKLDDPETLGDQDLDDAWDLADDIFRTMRGKTNLIFGNNKAVLEDLVDKLRTLCKEHRVPEEFFIHHGSLDKSIREAAETRMQSDEPGTTLCTNTLELGIDVGLIDTVGQLDPPWTVSSLAQRVGRSGRHEGEPSRLRFFVQEETPVSETELPGRLFPRLLQSVAMFRLFVVENWCEPFRPKRHYSTLVQQILSVLKQTGGVDANQLYEGLVDRGPFDDVQPSEFADLLRTLGEKKLLEQVPGTNNLILDVAGERIVNHFRFYAAFQTPERFDVRHNKDRIGEVDPTGIQEEDHLLLAGRRWEVEQVREKKKEILVFPTKGKKPPVFITPSMRNLHPRIRKEMRRILLSDDDPEFLDGKASELLSYAQEVAVEATLGEDRIVQRGLHSYLFHWAGDRVVRTIVQIASAEGYDVELSESWLSMKFNETDQETVESFLSEVANAPHSDIDLARQMSRPKKVVEKYDEYLPAFLLDRGYAHNYLNTAGAAEWADHVLREDVD